MPGIRTPSSVLNFSHRPIRSPFGRRSVAIQAPRTIYGRDMATDSVDPELKLPKRSSLICIIALNALSQVGTSPALLSPFAAHYELAGVNVYHRFIGQQVCRVLGRHSDVFRACDRNPSRVRRNSTPAFDGNRPRYVSPYRLPRCSCIQAYI